MPVRRSLWKWTRWIIWVAPHQNQPDYLSNSEIFLSPTYFSPCNVEFNKYWTTFSEKLTRSSLLSLRFSSFRLGLKTKFRRGFALRLRNILDEFFPTKCPTSTDSPPGQPAALRIASIGITIIASTIRWLLPPFYLHMNDLWLIARPLRVCKQIFSLRTMLTNNLILIRLWVCIRMQRRVGGCRGRPNSDLRASQIKKSLIFIENTQFIRNEESFKEQQQPSRLVIIQRLDLDNLMIPDSQLKRG